ncbi:hypothetical protein APHAL10511_001469 [Amanita phalloides]|nr:hypothetical protein APHAL10511_001469 [Amanita phalloides]
MKLDKIDYRQTMNMYNNSGNAKSDFSARYSKKFSLEKFEQKSAEYPPHSWNCVLNPSLDDVLANPINHLQVFEANKLTVAKLKLSFEFIVLSTLPETIPFPEILPIDSDNLYTQANADRAFDLDFSAETVARAVVGG